MVIFNIFSRNFLVSRQLSNIFICACVHQQQLIDNKCECKRDKDTQYQKTLDLFIKVDLLMLKISIEREQREKKK